MQKGPGWRTEPPERRAECNVLSEITLELALTLEEHLSAIESAVGR